MGIAAVVTEPLLSPRLPVMTQPCCIVPWRLSSCLHGRPCATQKPCLGVPESLLQELSNDVPNFFQALSRQILAFSKNPKSIKNGSPCHEPSLNFVLFWPPLRQNRPQMPFMQPLYLDRLAQAQLVALICSVPRAFHRLPVPLPEPFLLVPFLPRISPAPFPCPPRSFTSSV